MGSVSENADFFKDVTGWMGDMFSALAYFVGGDFAEAAAKGFMK